MICGVREAPGPGWWLAGVGVDVAHVARIARLRTRRELLAHVCAPDELPEGRVSDHFAARLWAAKEAVAKCLGTGFWQSGVGWLQVRVGPDWQVRLSGAAAQHAGPARIELFFEGPVEAPAAHVTAVALRWMPAQARA